ncbi:MAG: NUDIX domain-containing protein [Candidatus Liptonbacteria bacterium]|nr:NUDIX domain-containing protein [Candidatus Liptonbacteria bacterium]
MIFTEKPEGFSPQVEAAGCFVECGGNILLLHRQDHRSEGDRWGLPSGKLEQGESPLEAIVREIKEETGYHAKENELSFFRTVYVQYPAHGAIYHMYRLKLAAQPPISIDPEEHKAFQWVTPGAALRKRGMQDLDSCIKLLYGERPIKEKMNISQKIFGVIFVFIGVVLFSQSSATAPAPQPSASSAQPLSTYRDDVLGFSVRFNSSLISFEENFSIAPVAHPWVCKPRDNLTGEYLAPQSVPAETCRKPSFLEFVNYSASRGVRTIVQSASHTNVMILHSQTPMTNTLNGEVRNRDTYRIFVEAPAASKKAWALDLYLVPRKGTLLCKDNVCDIGEESPESLSYCKADCPNGKDWTEVLKETFASLQFTP